MTVSIGTEQLPLLPIQDRLQPVALTAPVPLPVLVTVRVKSAASAGAAQTRHNSRDESTWRNLFIVASPLKGK
jgi:hypothetical protein